MVSSSPFTVNDGSEILRFINANAFGQLLSISEG